MLNVNLLNRGYLESELEKVSLLELAEGLVERMKETVPYYEQGQRIMVELETFKDGVKHFVSAIFSILESEDGEAEEVSVEFESLNV